MTSSLFFVLISVVIHKVNGDYGQPARPGEYKWAAAIFHDSKFICTGSVLNPSYILTAGHCLFGRNATKLHVVSGSVLITALTGSSVQNVFIHPEYFYPISNSNIAKNDIGLIKLADPLNLVNDDERIPVSIESGPQYRYNCKQVLFRVRMTSTGPIAELRHSMVVVTDRQKCLQFFCGRLFVNQMCIVNCQETKNPQRGDSGSPTVCEGHVFGILNSGLCTTLIDGPAKILTVAPYLDWMVNLMDPWNNTNSNFE